jgi:hypothetical protein
MNGMARSEGRHVVIEWAPKTTCLMTEVTALFAWEGCCQGGFSGRLLCCGKETGSFLCSKLNMMDKDCWGLPNSENTE